MQLFGDVCDVSDIGDCAQVRCPQDEAWVHDTAGHGVLPPPHGKDMVLPSMDIHVRLVPATWQYKAMMTILASHVAVNLLTDLTYGPPVTVSVPFFNRVVLHDAQAMLAHLQPAQLTCLTTMANLSYTMPRG